MFLLPLIWLLFACGSPPQAVRTETIHMILQAGKDINPNQQGLANPVRVMLYQINKNDAFMMSDYFTLQEFTDPDLISQVDKLSRFIMVPGEKKEMMLKIKNDVSTIGVVTAYRDISRSQWRAVYVLPDTPHESGYARLWSSKKKEQLKVMVNMDYLTTSIEKVE